MPMDEIQDITLTRSMRRSERLSSLDEKFAGLADNRVRRTLLPADRFRIKIAYLPLVVGEVDLDEKTLGAFRHSRPTVTLNNKIFEHLSVLRALDHSGQPMLRGRIYEGNHDRGAHQVYCAALINKSLEMEWDYVDSGRFNDNGANPTVGMYDGWIIGFLASTIYSLQKVLNLHGALAQGILRTEIYVSGDQRIIVGDRLWQETSDLPSGHTRIPDFELTSPSDIANIFKQLQTDFYAIAGLEEQPVFVIEGVG